MKLLIGVILGACLSTSATFATESNQKGAEEILKSLKSNIRSALDSRRNDPLVQASNERLLVQCLDDEMQFTEIQSQVIVPLQTILAEKSFSNKDLFHKEFGFINFENFVYQNSKNMDGIRYSRAFWGSDKEEGKTNFNPLKKYLSDINEIEHVELAALDYLAPSNTRLNGQIMTSAKIKAHFDIRGKSKEGLIQKRGKFLIKTSKNEKGSWAIDYIKLLDGEKLVSERRLFKNITEESKVATAVPRHLRREAIRRGGYAMAIGSGDLNKPSDLFVATVAETVYLRGDKSLNYKATQSQQLSKETFVKAASFADFDKDGNEELLLVRFAPNETQKKNDRTDILVYKNAGKGYKKLQEVINFEKSTAYAMPLALGDFNADGLLDFYVGFPGAKDFTTLEPAIQKKGLVTQGVFLNKGENLFEYEDKKLLNNAHRVASVGYDDPSKIFPHSALAADLDANGSMDLIVVDDRANVSPIYFNNHGKFQIGEKIGLGLKDYGMGADIGDLNGDGLFDVTLSSVNFNSSKRMKTSCSQNWAVNNAITAGTSGLRVFTGSKSGKYNEDTQRFGLDFIGDGAGGVKIFDYNNDGHEDIYVTMGLWSGNDSRKDARLDSLFTVASSLGLLEDSIRSGLREKVTYGKAKQNNEFAALLFRSDSQSLVMDILSYYRNKENGASYSLAGFQRNKLFRNNGDGTFTEVGYHAGVDSIADGYMPAIADLNKDGKMDLILRNADPGFALDQFAPVEIFKNDISDGNAVTVKLRGIASNSDGVGAILTARIGKQTIKKQMIGSSGTVQSERIVHFGIGAYEKIDSLGIMWPSGEMQMIKNLKSGHHEIWEPRNEKVSMTK